MSKVEHRGGQIPTARRAVCLVAFPDLPDPAAARRLDAYDVSSRERERDLARLLRAVEEVPPGQPRLTSLPAARRMTAALSDERQPARLEHPQLANDAVAAPMPAAASRAEPQRMPLDADRIRELQRLRRSREGVRHRHVHTGGTVRIRARPLAAPDRLVVGEAIVPEREVVHRP